MIDYFFNPNPNQIKLLKEQKFIGPKSKEDQIQYWRMKIPMMSDRDNCIRQMTKKLDDGSIFILAESIKHEEAPEQEGVIRI